MATLVTIFSLIGRAEGLSDHLCVSMMGGGWAGSFPLLRHSLTRPTAHP